MRKRHFFAVSAGRMFLGDDVPMRVDFGITENAGNAIFKTLGDEVFQALRFLVNLIPRVLQNIVKE